MSKDPGVPESRCSREQDSRVASGYRSCCQESTSGQLNSKIAPSTAAEAARVPRAEARRMAEPRDWGGVFVGIRAYEWRIPPECDAGRPSCRLDPASSPRS